MCYYFNLLGFSEQIAETFFFLPYLIAILNAVNTRFFFFYLQVDHFLRLKMEFKQVTHLEIIVE